jgi:signal transduction histidine kinase
MTGIPRFEIAWFLGAILGAALLWGLFGSALRRKGLPLLVLFAAEALWYSGEALVLLIGQTVPGSPAIPWAEQTARLGLSLLPSSLLGATFAFAAGADVRIADRLKPYLLPLIFLPGLGVFLLGTWRLPNARLAFSLYAILCLTLSALLYLRLTDRSEMEVHRRFYRWMALALAGIAVLMSVVYPLNGIAHPGLGPALSLALFLSPLVPAFILGYFVYRYSFFRIVVNPTLLYSALTGIVLTVYLLGIRRIVGELRGASGGVSPDLVEATLLAALIFLFQPVKNRGQRLLNRLFFRARYDYQRLLRDLSQTLNIPFALDQRLRTALDAVSAALKVHLVSLVLFDREEGAVKEIKTISSQGLPGFPPPVSPFSPGPEGQALVARVAEWVSAYRRPLDIGELHRQRFVSPLVARGVRLCVPLLREERLVGLLCLGEKKREVPFSAEERELLDTLCNQMALAVENARLVEQRLDLERRMYEAERLSALGLLSASIAHEVKNPLGSIKTIAAVLREDLRNDPAKTEDLTIILNEIDRLSRTVERLLRFARPRQETALLALALKEILHDVVLVLAHEAERRRIAIRSEVEEDLMVTGNLEDLKEIFFNLILNGIQAMEAGGEIAVTARYHPGTEQALAPGGQGWVEIAVSDTGPGIPEDVRPHVFEPFYTTKASGTGLGLAIVKRDVERLGGTIELDAQDGQGATFILRLPGGDHER